MTGSWDVCCSFETVPGMGYGGGFVDYDLIGGVLLRVSGWVLIVIYRYCS